MSDTRAWITYACDADDSQEGRPGEAARVCFTLEEAVKDYEELEGE